MGGGSNCPASDVTAHLDWSAHDNGFNEGATCGLSVLTGLNLAGLPALVPQPILGNVFHRDTMMGFAKTAYRLGAKEQAVDVAICSQVHNDDAHACLTAHRHLVAAWFDTH
jgi:hypothetical protein